MKTTFLRLLFVNFLIYFKKISFFFNNFIWFQNDVPNRIFKYVHLLTK